MKKRFYRTAFILLGSVSFILTVGFCLHMPLLTSILPPAGSFPIHMFLASITASIGASLLWIGFSGELGAVAGGAIDLAVFYGGLTIVQLLSARHASQHLLAGVLLCLVALIVSLGIFLHFRRYPLEDRRLMPLPVRVSFGVFTIVLLLVGSTLLLQVPNVFAWTLDPSSAVLIGCFFLGSACYFLYGLLFPRWHNACGQLWSFLAYDLVLIVPFLFHFGTVRSMQLPSLIVNTIILVYSGTLAIYYLLIKKETRSRLNIVSLSSQVKRLEWSR
jgi:heme/copper-type cytochrome/quinol oxidase subunit 4